MTCRLLERQELNLVSTISSVLRRIRHTLFWAESMKPSIGYPPLQSCHCWALPCAIYSHRMEVFPCIHVISSIWLHCSCFLERFSNLPSSTHELTFLNLAKAYHLFYVVFSIPSEQKKPFILWTHTAFCVDFFLFQHFTIVIYLCACLSFLNKRSRAQVPILSDFTCLMSVMVPGSMLNNCLLNDQLVYGKGREKTKDFQSLSWTWLIPHIFLSLQIVFRKTYQWTIEI